MVFNAVFSTLIQLFRGGQCTDPLFPGVLYIPVHVLAMAAFPHNNRRNNGQR